MSTLARSLQILSTVVIASIITRVGLFVEADGSVRIKDITTVNNDRAIDLIGFGLVIGLDGSGDGKSASFT
ncbi:MAG: flagellar basal body P-ring protein FlgI, partial [candidate division Zixibacteria bacterium]|nr:flagellar basal body P-ring protein FlgI [candidate division Zixibacteria bacterium]